MTTEKVHIRKPVRRGDVVFPIVNGVILCIIMFVTLYPVLNTVAISFNDGTDALRGGIGLWPRVFSTKSYQSLLQDPATYQAAWISVSRTVITTILNLILTSMLAFTLSRREYVLRTYISGLPEALVESARIDGAGDFRIFWQIIFPLCKPVLATVALFVAVGSWNQWFDTHLYNAGKPHLHTLQYLLKMKLATTQASANAAKSSADAMKSTTQMTPITIRCAITVVSAVPILIVYPFLQRYFVTGMVLGSVKG